MRAVIHNKSTRSMVVVFGMVLWLIGAFSLSSLYGENSIIFFLPGYFILFLIACYLPELPVKSFSSRQSVLGGASVLIYLSFGSWQLKDGISSSSSNPMWHSTVTIIFPAIFPVVVAVIVYWLGFYFIRGLRKGC